MKRREFLSASAGVAGLLVHSVARSQTKPCPPPTIGVQGGTATGTSCGSDELSSWVPAPGTFADYSTNVAQDVDPGMGVWWGSSGYNAAFNAWTSGAFAPELGAQGSYVCWGGGHLGGSGNHVFRFDVATRLWSRMGNPAPYSPSASVDADGAFTGSSPPSPAAPHNYHTLGIRSSANGGGTYGSLIQATLPACLGSGGSATGAWWQFNFKTAIDAGPQGTAGIGWTKFVSTSTMQGNMSGRTMVQESNGNFWWFGIGSLTSHITRVSQAGVITSYAVGINTDTYTSGGCVGSTRFIVLNGLLTSGTQTWIFDLAAIEGGATAQGTAWKRVYPTGTAGAGSDSLTWCPDLNKFASIVSSSPTTVRWLVPSNPADPWNSTWAWQNETFTAAGGASARAIENGGHGRFVWCPAIKCFLHAARAEWKMQAYRPAGT